MLSSRSLYNMGSGQTKGQNSVHATAQSPRKDKYNTLPHINVNQKSSRRSEYAPQKQNLSQRQKGTNNQSSKGIAEYHSVNHKYTSRTEPANHKPTPRAEPANHKPTTRPEPANQKLTPKPEPANYKPTPRPEPANHKLTPRPEPANYKPTPRPEPANYINTSRPEPADHKSVPRPVPANQSPQQQRSTDQKSQQFVHFEDQLEWEKKNDRFDHLSLYDLDDEDSVKKTSNWEDPRNFQSEKQNVQHLSSRIAKSYDEIDELSQEDINSFNKRYMNTPRLKKEKIETALRSSRVPETKVRHLAAHISHIPGDDGTTAQEHELNTTEKILRKTISHQLDPILHGTLGKTNLNHYEQNPQGLAKKVSEMIQQVDLDLQNCLDNLDTKEDEGDMSDGDVNDYQHNKGKHGRAVKQTDGQKTKENVKMFENKKSLTLTIQNGIRSMKTNYEILLERYETVMRENEQIGSNNEKNEANALRFQEENLKLEKAMNALKQKLNHSFTELEQASVVHDKLKMKIKESEIEKTNLIQQNERLLGLTKGLTRELNKLQDEVAQTAVENIRLTKEFRKLQEPDKKIKQQIQRMESELQELRTQNRRLENEKGTIRAALQKLEATYEVTQVDRKYLAREKEALVKEMNNLKAEKRKLILSG